MLLGRSKEKQIKHGARMGGVIFNQTPNGQLAEGMVGRGEIADISAGYQVRSWEISDSEGKILDPDSTPIRFDLTFTATRWQLNEGSLCLVPADAKSNIRNLGCGVDSAAANTRARMEARARMTTRMAAFGMLI